MAELMTTAEAASYLRLAIKTLHQWRYLHTGPPWIKVGAVPRYDRAALDQWLAQRTSAPATSRQSH